MSLATHGLPFTKLSKALPAPVLQELLVYYGYPISYKGLNDVAAIVTDISFYKYWVCGDGYSNPGHPEYATTVAIIQGVRSAGTKVYGYVPIGQSTQGLSVSVIQSRIDEWFNIGVDGIFLDEFGFDYGNTRAKQIQIVNHVRSLGLPLCANTWTAQDFLADNVSELPWGSGDWRYNNFVTYNPDNLPLLRDKKDSMLMENFCFDHNGPMGVFDVQELCSLTTALAASKSINIWALAVFGESAPGVPDVTKLGSSGNLTNAGAYIAANAYIYGITVVGTGGYSFGSNGTPIRAPLPRLPAAATAAETTFIDNYVTGEASRSFGNVLVTVKNLTTQSFSVSTTLANSESFDNMSKTANITISPSVMGQYTTTVTDYSFIPGMLVNAAVVPNSEHDSDDLTDVGLIAIAVNGGVEFTLSTNGILVGTYKVLYNKG